MTTISPIARLASARARVETRGYAAYTSEKGLHLQLRRIAQAIHEDTSISDSADTLRLKLLLHGPRQLTGSLQASILEALPGSPEAGDKPTYLAPQHSASMPTLPHMQTQADGPQQHMFDPSWPHSPNRGASGTRCNERPMTAPEKPASVQAQPIPAAQRAARLSPLRHSASASAAASPMHVKIEEENLLKFLVEHGEVKESKDFSVVLSRVVASAERLEMEYVYAANQATSDSQRAVEAARLSCLRTTISGLRETQKQCQHLLKQAQADVARLAAELTALKRQARLKDQELRRLRWRLANDDVQDVKLDAMLSFMSTKGVDKASGRLMISHDLEKRAFQSQLDEATALAEDLASTLRKEREASAKKVVEEALGSSTITTHPHPHHPHRRPRPHHSSSPSRSPRSPRRFGSCRRRRGPSMRSSRRRSGG